MTPEEAAAVRSVRDLPGHLQADADKLLTEYAEAMEAEGYAPTHVARDTAHVLLKLAFFEPDECPTLDAVRSGHVAGGWPWEANLEMKTDMFDDRGYGRAFDLWRERQETEAVPA